MIGELREDEPELAEELRVEAVELWSRPRPRSKRTITGVMSS